jgi:hypothetical protein
MAKGLSDEYREYIQSEAWRNRAKLKILPCTGSRCGLIPLLRATQCDHLTYRNMGSEMFLRDCIPLNKYTHSVVTVLRDIARCVCGRRRGNQIVAWAMRLVCIFWLPFILFFYTWKNALSGSWPD